MGKKRLIRLKEDDFGSVLYLESLHALSMALSKQIQHSRPITAKYLGQVSYQLQQFMETHLGQYSSRPNGIVKIPARFFRSFQVYGPLYIILQLSLQFSDRNNWDTFDILNIERRDYGLELINQLIKTLVEKSLLSFPKVYFLNISNGNVLDQLSSIVINHRGAVVDDINLATCLIEMTEDIDSPDDFDRDESIRAVDVRSDGMILVHYCYYPDHYDEWVKADDVDSIEQLDIVDITPPLKVWRLSHKYITDCEVFNEWGNEYDYEMENESETDVIDDSNVDYKSIMGAAKKPRYRKNEIKFKNKLFQEAVMTEKIFSDVAPLSTTASSMAVYEVAVDPQRSYLNQVGVTTKRKHDDILDTPAFTNKSTSSYIGKALTYPDWFKNESISAFEARYMPELLTRSSKINASEYLRIRGQIISLYSKNPALYLTATESRQHISGDIGVTLAIHNFLDAFSVINQGVRTETRPTTSVAVFPYLPDNASCKSVDMSSPTEIDLLLLSKITEIGDDWVKISQSMKSHGVDLSPDQCLVRFLAMANVDELTQDLSTNKSPTDTHTETSKSSASFMVSLLASKREEEIQLQLTIQDYLQVRLAALEEKMNLFTDLQGVLHDDRERLEIERRDLIIQKAQFAHGQNQQNKS